MSTTTTHISQTTAHQQHHIINSKLSIIPSPAPFPALPPGELTLLLGDPGTGKSLLAIDLAARLSRGEPLPANAGILPASSFSAVTPSPSTNSTSHPGTQSSSHPVTLSPCHPITNFLTPSTCLLLSLEDSPSTIHSRFLAANADLHYLHHIAEDLDLVPPNHGLPRSWVREDSHPKPPPLIAKLEEFLLTVENFRLLILDPLPAFLGPLDCPSQSAIRRTLRPLFLLAQKHNFAILGISHLNKQNHSANPLRRSAGSFAYTALARSVFLLTQDVTRDPASSPGWSLGSPISRLASDPAIPNDHSPNTPDPLPPSPSSLSPQPSSLITHTSSLHSDRLLIPLKNNLAPITHAYSLAIQSKLLDPTNPASLPIGCIHWNNTPVPLPNISSPCTATPENPIEKTKLELAIDFLTTSLAQGPIPLRPTPKEHRSLGLSQRTLDRARETLNIRFHHHGPTNKWFAVTTSQQLPNPPVPHSSSKTGILPTHGSHQPSKSS